VVAKQITAHFRRNLLAGLIYMSGVAAQLKTAVVRVVNGVLSCNDGMIVPFLLYLAATYGAVDRGICELVWQLTDVAATGSVLSCLEVGLNCHLCC